MRAHIYRPSKSAMQSGRGNTRMWVLRFEKTSPRGHDPLMGWTSSADTRQQIRMRFASEAEAIAYCKRHGIDYSVDRPRERRFKPKSYAANFSWDRP